MIDSIIEGIMSGLYNFLSFAVSIYNKQVQMAAGMLGQDPVTFSGSGWKNVTNVNTVFLSIGAVLVVIFFLMGFCAESIDIRQDFRIENIVRMFVKLSLAEFFVVNSLTIVRQCFAFSTGIIQKLTKTALTVNVKVPMDVMKITRDPVNNGISGIGGLAFMAVLYITALVFLFVASGCGMMILYEAYQRFFKILMLVPYGTLASSTMAGNHMLNRSAEAFWKFAFATIMEAVTMFIAMALSAAILSSGMLGLSDGWTGGYYILGWILESSFICMLTLGLIKGSEMLTQKVLGL